MASNQTPVAAQVSIGTGLASDAEAIAALGAKVFTESFGFAVPDDELANYLASTYSTEAMAAEMAKPEVTTFVARDSSGQLVGFVQLVLQATDAAVDGDPSTHAELQRLYVDASAHGRGIGTKLAAAVEAMAREEGVKKLWLTVWQNSAPGQRLYSRLGYVKTGETDYSFGTCVHIDYVFVKDL
ncbi:acyl-CoA N-acyltransferase [Thozetella sp. PMI_491]|nr:acyl-CoA N-acyltransferase [Thozetella sp. PMI_491]